MRIANRAVGLVVVSAVALATTLPAQIFDPLFRVTGVKGICQVRKPEAAAFAPVVLGKAYPFGTVVRTEKNGEAVINLSTGDAFRMQASTEVIVRVSPGSDSNRLVQLESGKIQSDVHENLPEDAVVVETAVGACDAFTGRSDIQMSRDKNGLRLEVTTGSGSARVRGPQFAVPKLKAGCSIRITSSEDRSLTRLVNTGGDYKMNLDNGTDTPVLMDTSTKSTIKIVREHAPMGGKLAVSVFAEGPDGKGRESFAYVVGEPNLTAGGLPVLPEDHSPSGGVATATSPEIGGIKTNAVKAVKEGAEALFK